MTVRMSLVNHGDFDVDASIRLRHDDGWWLSPESPEVTVKAQQGPADVSATFRPSPGHGVGASDELSVEVQVDGFPVAHATAPVRRRPASSQGAGFSQGAALAAAGVIMFIGGAAAIDRTIHDSVTTTTSVPGPSTTTTTARPPATATTVPPPAPTSTAPTPDVCPNVPGDQPSLPPGFVIDVPGNCVPELQPCDASTESGGAGTTVTLHELNRPGPLSFEFDYETVEVPDEIVIRYEDNEVFRVGPVATNGTVSTTVNLPAGTSTQIEVTVIGPSGTRWNHTVGCPTGQ